MRINRADDLISVLRDLGINVDQIQRVNKSFQYPRDIDTKEIELVTRNAVEHHKISKDLVVGHYRKTAVSHYFDLIGAACSPEAAPYFANILSAYWSLQIKEPYNIKHINFDFVVTPKGGSPLLGYEFSKLVQKPFILHVETPRFESSSDDMRQSFNCCEYPPKGAIMLIVDNSITGAVCCRG